MSPIIGLTKSDAGMDGQFSSYCNLPSNLFQTHTDKNSFCSDPEPQRHTVTMLSFLLSPVSMLMYILYILVKNLKEMHLCTAVISVATLT